MTTEQRALLSHPSLGHQAVWQKSRCHEDMAENRPGLFSHQSFPEHKDGLVTHLGDLRSRFYPDILERGNRNN